MTGLLILVKHSEPEVIQDVPAREWRLSESGRIRAKRLADQLAQYDPRAVASSIEPKALETADIISWKLGLSLQVAENLHEHDRHAVPFMPRAEFERAVQEFFERPGDLVFGNESADQAHERFRRAVNRVTDEHQDKTVILVSHGTVIALFVSRLTGEAAFPVWRDLGLPAFVVGDWNSKAMLELKNITEGN